MNTSTREKNLKLTVELVPVTSHLENVRKHVSKTEWDNIRGMCYAIAKHKCQICGDTGKNQGLKHNVECHEVWDYDDETKTQTLVDFVALCPQCHSVKHIGLAVKQNRLYPALNQLVKVNNMTLEEAEEYVLGCFEQTMERNRHQWKVDISYKDLYI